MNKIELSIIIVTFNSEKYIKDCVDSIVKYCLDINYEIVIVDNNSIDNTVKIIKEDFKDIVLIESINNLGFAGGNNLGTKHCRGEYFLLLNHDTILLEKISVILNVFNKNIDIGALGIKMLNGDMNYECSAGNFPKPYQLLKLSLSSIKSKEFITGNFKEPYKIRAVDWVSGAFLLTKKEYWNQVGGLDEKYFMYVEDVDFCKKLSLIGKSTVFLPSVSYLHFVGFNNKREVLLIKGYKIFSQKFFSKYGRKLANICLDINYEYKKAFKNFY